MTTSKPSRRRYFARWLIIATVLLFAWAVWRVVSQRLAIRHAVELGWIVTHVEIFDEVKNDWRAAFRSKTWNGAVTYVRIPTGREFEENRELVQRLNPVALQVLDADAVRDLSALNGLTKLKRLFLGRCRELANVDALAGQSRLEGISFGGCERLADLEAVRNLRMLEFLWLRDCKGLRNVAGLSGFKGLRDVDLTGCTGLTRESIDALKAALPDAKIAGP